MIRWTLASIGVITLLSVVTWLLAGTHLGQALAR
jgi:hypothetical protein